MDRIAGYLSSAVLEVGGAWSEEVPGPIRVVCNTQLRAGDVQAAQAEEVTARWRRSHPERWMETPERRLACERLADAIRAGRIEIRVVPDNVHGLIHAKAGVLTDAEGRKTAFAGSANATWSGERSNYEIVWEDDCSEAVAWMQHEFDRLWNDPAAFTLPEAIVGDLERLAHRELITTVEAWRERPSPASLVLERPVYGEAGDGLWPHQKTFIAQACRDVHKPGGARYVLADQVGLGKSLQVGVVAVYAALVHDLPAIIACPKALVRQWQDELARLLDLPSAAWLGGGQWRLEDGHRQEGVLNAPPRRIVILSTGLLQARHRGTRSLYGRPYAAVVLDEAHRARRSGAGRSGNELYQAVRALGERAHSMLLVTGTPIQLKRDEAYDLMCLMEHDSGVVLGADGSLWRHDHGRQGLARIDGRAPDDHRAAWDWLRNPLPDPDEDALFREIRDTLGTADETVQVASTRFDELWAKVRDTLDNDGDQRVQRHSPYVRRIVRRTRAMLEQTENPRTGAPYLRHIATRRLGEETGIAVEPRLAESFRLASELCEALGARRQGSRGLMESLVLRRLSSSVRAGLDTVRAISGTGQILVDEEDDWEEDRSSALTLTADEGRIVEALREKLEPLRDCDPKTDRVIQRLEGDGVEPSWATEGTIVFSQYWATVDSIADALALAHPEWGMAIYAGQGRCERILGGERCRATRQEVRSAVDADEVAVLIATDAASEGLNLQTMGTIINVDLPWNPAVLDQRRGRIMRGGQRREEVSIDNLRYEGSVEDRVHARLSARLEDIYRVFGEIPETIEDLWMETALGRKPETNERAPTQAEGIVTAFERRYRNIEDERWEREYRVLSGSAVGRALRRSCNVKELP